MRNDPSYEWWEYACHEGNTIVPNYTNTSRHERANPVREEAKPIQVAAEIANALAGRWVGRPEIKTIEYDIEIEFVKNADGTVLGRLVQTTLPDPREPKPINQPLANFVAKERRLNWTFPNTQSWAFAGELTADGTAINGVTSSAQGGVRLTFRKR
jgi:hypothetical protein